MKKFAPIAFVVLLALVACNKGADSNETLVRKAFLSYIEDELGVRPSMAKIDGIKHVDTLSAESLSSRVANVYKLFVYSVASARKFNEEHSDRIAQTPEAMDLVNVAVECLSAVGDQIDTLVRRAGNISFDGTAYGYEVDFTLDGPRKIGYTSFVYLGEDGSVKGIGRSSDATSFVPGYDVFSSLEDKVVHNLTRINDIYSELEKSL